MTEPRARLRQKGGVFSISDLTELLYAFGDVSQPLESTARVLDEILTDFIIETCHAAGLCASYSRRQKIKVDDFRWVLRRNGALLGRVQESLARAAFVKHQRNPIDVQGLGGDLSGLMAVAGMAGVEADELKHKGPGRGRRKRKVEDEDAQGGSQKKKARSGSQESMGSKGSKRG